MQFDKLDYILAVAETQNLTRAARQLYISQPALTNYINKLEDELGVKLFDRSVSPVRLTEAGSFYIEKMKQIRQQSDVLEAQLREFSHRSSTLNLGIGTSRGMYWLPRIVPAFNRRHPELSLSFQQMEDDKLERMTRDGLLDVSFGVFSSIYLELSYVPVAVETIYLAVPRTFRCVSSLNKGEGTPENPYHIPAESLNGMPLLLPRSSSDFYRTITAQLEQHHVRPGVTHTHGTLITAMGLAARGLGAMFVSNEALELMPTETAAQLVLCTLCDPPIRRNSLACYAKDSGKAGLIREMIDLAVREIGNL